MRFALALGVAWLVAPVHASSRIEDLVRIHVEAMGGRERIEALSALQATGEVRASGQRLEFHLLAARPNRLRLETEALGRRRVQGTNGVQTPWEMDSGTVVAASRAMAPGVARTFLHDAEFDDPLVAGAGRKYALDFAGETARDGGKLLRILVTRPGVEPFSVLLDAATYLIVERTETRATATGRSIQAVIRYSDFRPVGGVLLPHAFSTSIDGRITQETRIIRMEPNPPVLDRDFAAPDTH